ncbi:MAG TPA: cytochrome c peroxidase [Stellaceae bacterium]|nr:cytochrome c peroxidase [Stellaceae bacterium]
MPARRLWAAPLGALAAVAITVIGMTAGGLVPLQAWLTHPRETFALARGENPYPVRLMRPQSAPFSAMAQLGRLIFFDASLSSSGKLACATCHDPQRAYGPPGDLPAIMGGPSLSAQGVRAVPSLMYLERQPSFSIGPDKDEDETVSLLQLAAAGRDAARAQKVATDTAAASANLVPQGGLFWDGRADTLQQQALFPLLSPFEMDGGSVETVAAKLRQSPYANRFVQLFGTSVFGNPNVAVGEALFAVGRYEFEDAKFHLYTSKFDYWLEGRARFTSAELRGYLLFNDPAKANCGGCHLDKPSVDGLPPLFTDHQYEALGVPRNPALAANDKPGHFDLGICGPYRDDMKAETQYCAMFATPTLRNVATRRVFFHNGVYHTLEQVLDFYNFRETNPEKIYPCAADGTATKYDDIPPSYRANIDTADPPFDRKLGEAPAMTPSDEADIVAFLKTLTDGYQPAD